MFGVMWRREHRVCTGKIKIHVAFQEFQHSLSVTSSKACGVQKELFPIFNFPLTIN